MNGAFAGENNGQRYLTTEVFNGVEFEAGPDLPNVWKNACAKKISDDRTIISGGHGISTREDKSILIDHALMTLEYLPNNMVRDNKIIICLAAETYSKVVLSFTWQPKH